MWAAACACVAPASYLFVEDVAEAFDTVLHKGETGEVYNIGTEKERTVKEVRALFALVIRAAPSTVVCGQVLLRRLSDAYQVAWQQRRPAALAGRGCSGLMGCLCLCQNCMTNMLPHWAGRHSSP